MYVFKWVLLLIQTGTLSIYFSSVACLCFALKLCVICDNFVQYLSNLLKSEFIQKYYAIIYIYPFLIGSLCHLSLFVSCTCCVSTSMQAFMCLFQILTQEGWVDVANDTAIAVGTDGIAHIIVFFFVLCHMFSMVVSKMVVSLEVLCDLPYHTTERFCDLFYVSPYQIMSFAWGL